VGVVCVRPEGINPDSFVHFYFGKIYTPSKWFEREAAIEVLKSRVPSIKGLRGDFYNMVLDVPASLPGGYCPLFTDPRHEGTIASRLCHSCEPNCKTAVVSHGGKLRVALHTFKRVEYGCVLSYDYHCSTDDEAEYYNSKCLCGAQECNTLYLSLAAGHFDAIMEAEHTVLHRVAMLVRACESAGWPMSKRVSELLASVGFGKKIFRDSPMWLKCYCASVIEFIKHERSTLPRLLASKFPTIYANHNAAEVEADGVQGMRLQNLAIMVDRVLSFLRRQPSRLTKTSLPLYQLNDAQAAQKLVFGDDSIWATLREFVVSRERTFRLKTAMEGVTGGGGGGFGRTKPTVENARKILRDTAVILRKSSMAYAPAADVLEVRLP